MRTRDRRRPADDARPASPALVEALDRRSMLSASKATVTPPRVAKAAPVLATPASATLPARQVENLDRGLVATKRASAEVYLSWRLLGLDPSTVAFNVYRSANGGAATKLNSTPITATTDYVDRTFLASATNAYTVRPVVNGVEQAASKAATLGANAPLKQYLSIPLVAPPATTTPDGFSHPYTAGDASVGDLDGDGSYEVVLKWLPERAEGSSDNAGMYLDAYRLDGTRLWRAYTGRNVANDKLQFIVYDLDGDGRAEVALNTGDGGASGTGQTIGDPTKTWESGSGHIYEGPEFLTLLDGRTGAILSNTPLTPARGNTTDWGDNYGHRSDGHKPTVAYLDGVRPSLVWGRGIYHAQGGTYRNAKTELVAYDWRGGQLTQRWTFTAREGANPLLPEYVGQGNHQSVVGDVDGDGRDEIVWGAMTVDDDGTGLYSTRLGHGDTLHLGDFDPSRPGIEVFGAHESPTEYTRDTDGDGVAEDNGASFRSGATGQVYSRIPGYGGDVGRGVIMDLDPRPGAEMWSSADGNIWNVDGTVVQAKPSNMFTNFGVWWDADPYRELLDRTTISDWRLAGGTGTGGRVNFDLDPATSGVQIYAPDASANNGTKYTPALSGDLFGDWREEVIWRTSDSSELRIFSTVIGATNRMVTLMHDVQYREAIAWQNVGYNQPPNPSFFLGNGMATPPAPNVYYAGAGVYQAEAATVAGGVTLDSNNAGFNGTAFANFPATGGSVTWNLVDGGAGGLVTLGFRAALGGTTPRTGQLVVNGVAQNVTFAPTGAFATWAVTNVTVPLKAGATNTIQLLSTGQDLANVDELQVPAPSGPGTAPTIATMTVNDGAAQRSRVTSLTLTFDQPVSVDPAGVTLTRRGGGGGAQPFVLTPAADGRSARVTFAGAGLAGGGSLADGVYDVAVAAGAARDAAGRPLAAAYAATLHRLFGDLDGDGAVDVGELGAFATAYGSSRGATPSPSPSLYDALLDADDDGLIGVADLGAFATNYGVRIYGA